MKVIFYAPKPEVYDYFKKGGEFETEMRKYREGFNQRAYWSRIFRPNLIGFNTGVGFAKVSKKVLMWLIESESTTDKTVFKIKPNKGYLILGISFFIFGLFFIPLIFLGIFPIIAYLMNINIMKNKFRSINNSIISSKFKTSII